jgi:hypothetical protein
MGVHTVVGPVPVRILGVSSAGAIPAVLARLLAAALRVSTFLRRVAAALRRHRQSTNEMPRAKITSSWTDEAIVVAWSTKCKENDAESGAKIEQNGSVRPTIRAAESHRAST